METKLHANASEKQSGAAPPTQFGASASAGPVRRPAPSASRPQPAASRAPETAPLTKSIFRFDQAEAVRLGLDCSDLVFLDWFAYWAGRGRMEHIERPAALGKGQTLYWLSYGHVVASLPILRLQKRGLAKRLDKLVAAHVLTFEQVKNARGRGTRTYYGFGEAWDSLVYDKSSMKDHCNAGCSGPADQCNSSSRGGATRGAVVPPTTATPVAADCAVSNDYPSMKQPLAQQARSDSPVPLPEALRLFFEEKDGPTRLGAFMHARRVVEKYGDLGTVAVLHAYREASSQLMDGAWRPRNPAGWLEKLFEKHVAIQREERRRHGPGDIERAIAQCSR